ncbi:MAG TPA: hypothetical protein VJ725_16190, partial [Thermoanaerobaculia bacterium]|nr:hypothetical protein [Thermoanaerobaculia bacterium]
MTPLGRPRRGLGGAAPRRGLGDRGHGPAVLQELRPAGGREIGVERHPGAARLDHAQERHEEGRRALQGDRHGRFGAHPLLPQAPGQGVGARVELPVGERLVLAHHRQGLRRALHPRREPREDQGRLRGFGRGAPAGQELLTLLGREQGQVGDPGLRDVEAVEQVPEVPGQALHGRGLEQVGSVFEAAGKPFGRLGEAQLQVELGVRERGLGHAQAQARRQLVGQAGVVLQQEEGLEQRRARQVPLRGELLDQLLEREIAQRVGGHGLAPHPGQQLQERGLSRQIGAQGEGVHEQAGEPLDLHAVAVGHGEAHHQVLLAARAVKEGGERGQERHEQGRARAPGQLAQGRGPGRLHVEDLHGPAGGGHGGPGAVRGQLQDVGRSGQALAPGREAALQGLAREPPPLPDREVGVLDRQRGERRGPSVQGRGHERRELADEDLHGAAVQHRVVGGQVEAVLLLGEAREERADERACFEVEQPARLGRGEAGGFRVPRLQGKGREVRGRERHALRREDSLDRRALPGREHRAQGLVPARDLAQGTGQGLRRQRAFKLQNQRHVVCGRAGLQAVEEPEALLGEGEGRGIVLRTARNERRRLSGAARPVEPRGQGGHGGRLEQGAQLDLDPQPLPHPGHQPGGEERVAAQVEERVVDSHALAAQEPGPEAGQQLLDRGAGRRRGPFGLRSGLRGPAGQGRAV